MARTMLAVAATLIVTMISACASDSTPDEAAVPADTAQPMAGMPHDSAMMGDMQHAQPKDADHEFLMMMSSHHEGLVQMAMAAMDKAAAETARADAHMLHTKQAAERDSMVAMIQRDYQMPHQPMVMPKNRAQADSLSSLSGPEYDRAFYRTVIDHHREGTAMIDQFLPRLNKPALRTMAEKMRSDQQREIDEFQRKMTAR